MRTCKLCTKLLLLLLSLCMVLTAFAACATEEEDARSVESTEADNGDETLDDDLYDENGYLKDQLPDEDLDYGNKELKILCWASPANEFGCERPTAPPSTMRS